MTFFSFLTNFSLLILNNLPGTFYCQWFVHKSVFFVYPVAVKRENSSQYNIPILRQFRVFTIPSLCAYQLLSLQQRHHQEQLQKYPTLLRPHLCDRHTTNAKPMEAPHLPLLTILSWHWFYVTFHLCMNLENKHLMGFLSLWRTQIGCFLFEY